MCGLKCVLCGVVLTLGYQTVLFEDERARRMGAHGRVERPSSDLQYIIEDIIQCIFVDIVIQNRRFFLILLLKMSFSPVEPIQIIL